MTTPKDDTLSTLLGGEQIEVRYADGEHRETVLVRALPISQIGRLGQVADREDLLIELYCDRPAGWADTLVQESAELVLTTGERLNWDFFLRWLQRRMKRGKALDPQFEARAEAIVNAAVKEALGKSISGASASSSAAGSADSRLR